MKSQDYENSFIRGTAVEEEFIQVALHNGYYVKRATKQQDMKNHIDIQIRKGENEKIYSIDVKAPKRINRYDSEESLVVTWVEFENVRGKDGWLYGDQDLLAFDVGDRFVLVRRDELLNYLESIVLLVKDITNNRMNADYKFYRRKGREDVISQININDLYLLEHRIWMKPIKKA